LLRDRAERITRKAAHAGISIKTQRENFDPFEITEWRVIVGADPGYLPKAGMPRLKDGWSIKCRACQCEFESKGWAYCRDCLALPADERRVPSKVGRPCEGPGCSRRIPPWRHGREVRKDVRFCSDKCRKAAARLSDIGSPHFVRDQRKEVPISCGSVLGPKTMPPMLRSLPDWLEANYRVVERADNAVRLTAGHTIAERTPGDPGPMPEFLRRSTRPETDTAVAEGRPMPDRKAA
jgi:hypothetical protein